SVGARITFAEVPVIPEALVYLAEGAYPDGSFRNWKSYAHKVGGAEGLERMMLLSDPQTSGGLLISVSPATVEEVKAILTRGEVPFERIGTTLPAADGPVVVVV